MLLTTIQTYNWHYLKDLKEPTKLKVQTNKIGIMIAKIVYNNFSETSTEICSF